MNADFTEPNRRDVFPEAARLQLRGTAGKGLRQPLIVLRGVLMNGFFRAAMHAGITLLIADNAVHLNPHRACMPLLEHAGLLAFGLQDAQASCIHMVNV
ncbi:hypothetical protein D3C86_1532620 [compost metagenome]